MALALHPKRIEVKVSESLKVLGETLIISFVKELPPKLYCSNRVSLESL